MTTRHNTADFSTAALPSPVGAIGSKGPWQLSDGSVLFFVYSTSTGVITPKRSNPAVGINTAGSWSSKSTWTVPSWSSQTLNGFGGFQVGDTIHIAVINQSNNTLYYQSYNASTDTWGTSTAVSTATKASSARCAIVVRSTGDIVIGYENAPTISAAARTRPNYARRISGTWTADVNVSGDTTSAFNQPLNSVTLGASNRVHFTYWTGASPFTWQHRSLDSTNALDTAQQWLTGVTSITSFFTGGMSDYMVNQAGSTVICVPVSYFSSTSGQWVTGVMNAISQANATPEYTGFPTQYNFQDQNIVGMSNTHASWDPNPHRFRWMAVYTATSPSPPIAFYYDYADTFHVGDTYSDNINDFNPDLETPEFTANNSTNNYYGAKAIQDPTDGSIWVVGINNFSYAAITAYQEYAGPGTPTNLLVEQIGANGAQLVWTNAGAATSFKVYRNGTLLATTTNTWYTDTSGDPTTSYTYAVSGVAHGFESPTASVICVTQPFRSPGDLVGIGSWFDAFTLNVLGGVVTNGSATLQPWPDIASGGIADVNAWDTPLDITYAGTTGPIYRQTGINGNPAFDFSSMAGSLYYGGRHGAPTDSYVFMVMQPGTLPGTVQSLFMSDNGANPELVIDASNVFKLRDGNLVNSVGTVAATANTPTLVTVHSNTATPSSSLTIEKKGGSPTTDTSAVATLTPSRPAVGTDTSTGSVLNGDIGEFFYMEGPLSATNLANVQNYLRNKWLLTTAPTVKLALDACTGSDATTSVIVQTPISGTDAGTLGEATNVTSTADSVFYTKATAATELAGIGGTMDTTFPGAVSTESNALAKATGWAEILAKGSTAAWPALGAQGAVTGKGWWHDSTDLEGKTLGVGALGIDIGLSTNAGSPVVTVAGRLFKWSSGGGFTLLDSATLVTGATLSTSYTQFSWNPTGLNGVILATGEKLYFDIWVNVTGASGSNSATMNYQQNASWLDLTISDTPPSLTITTMDFGAITDSPSALAVIPGIFGFDAGAVTESGVSYTVNKMPPDAVLATTNIANTLASVTDDPDAPDGTFDNATIITNADDMRTSFGTPTGALKTGGPYQEFRIYLRPSGG